MRLAVRWIPVIAVLAAVLSRAPQTPPAVRWRDCLNQPAEWYRSAEARRIAEIVLLHQRDIGGWDKNREMSAAPSEAERAALVKETGRREATIDNGATYTQLAFLAKAVTASRNPEYKSAFLRGFDYLLTAQYPNGGWPQYFPPPRGYYTHITFNDDAMVGVLNLLQGAARNDPDYGFVDEMRRKRAREAVRKGVEVILKCQVVVNGRKTSWCAQHDETTLKPAPARTYEKVSLSGSESAGVARFLMGHENQTPELRAAVESAVDWFKSAAIHGIRVVRRAYPMFPNGTDVVVIPDPGAPRIWARFYEIGTNRPIFCGRDGIVKYSLAEIEHERRTGYAWYTRNPERLLTEDYPAWKRRDEERSLRPQPTSH